MDKDKYEQLIELIERRYQEGFRKGKEEGEATAVSDLVKKLEATYPREPKPKRPRRAETRPRLFYRDRFQFYPLQARITGEVRPALVILLGAVGLVFDNTASIVTWQAGT